LTTAGWYGKLVGENRMGGIPESLMRPDGMPLPGRSDE
jgi:hypothetical protein